MNEHQDLHELVQEHEKGTAGWRMIGYAGAAVVILAAAVGLGLFLQNGLKHRVNALEKGGVRTKHSLIREEEKAADLRDQLRGLLKELVKTGQITPAEASAVSPQAPPTINLPPLHRPGSGGDSPGGGGNQLKPIPPPAPPSNPPPPSEPTPPKPPPADCQVNILGIKVCL